MKVLLINPQSTLNPQDLAMSGDVPPLWLLDVGTQAEKRGHEVIILDASVERLDVKTIISKVKNYKPDIIGITSLSSNFVLSKQIATEIKKIVNIPLVLGGVHATAMTKECVELELFDYVISGEGDESFSMLLDAIEKNKEKNIPGLNYKVDDKIIINPFVRPADLKKLYMRNWDLVNIKKYKPSPASYTRLPAVSTNISRGCPHHSCTFCASRCTFGDTYRSYSLEQIKNELEYFKKKGIKDINFVDINFTTDKKHTIEVSKLLGKYGFKWNVTTRCDYVDLELLKIMAENGCSQIGFGIEVGTQDELKKIKKGYTLKQIRKAVDDTVKAGISVKCFFSIGYPWQKKDNIQRTIDFAKELNPDIATFSIINPYPGTELFDKYADKKTFNFDTMSHRSASNTISENFTQKELTNIMNSAYRQFYYRPVFIFNFFFRYFKSIKSFDDILNIFRGLRFIINK